MVGRRSRREQWLARAARSLIIVPLGMLSVSGAVPVTPANPGPSQPAPRFDWIIRSATIYDGSGNPPFVADVAIRGERIAAVGHFEGNARQVVEARGYALAPGFINMLSWANESLLVDGRAQSDLRQGITLEVLGEGWSMGPYSPEVRRQTQKDETDIRYPVDWTRLDTYLRRLESRGIAPNVASFVGATTIREDVLGYGDVQPTAQQLVRMRRLVRRAMEDGALGVSSALIYPPATYAGEPELAALAQVAGACGGIYITHIRSEGDQLLEALDEAIGVGRKSGAPVEIYHLKSAGAQNHAKFAQAIARIELARKSGQSITADMYTYTSALASLSAALPPWVQEGNQQTWLRRLQDPAIRARVISEMRAPNRGFENYFGLAGAAGSVPVAFKSARLKPLAGKSIAEIAASRHVSPEEALLDLMVEDGSPVGAIFFLTTEDEVRQKIRIPWISFGSDAAAPSEEGIFLASGTHPRAYGNLARLLGRYVRDEHLITLAEAVHRLSAMPAATLGLQDRGEIAPGRMADLVLFDPATIKDLASYEHPHTYARGVTDVWVNGMQALADGRPTGAHSGKVVRGHGWRGYPGGGCRPTAIGPVS